MGHSDIKPSLWKSVKKATAMLYADKSALEYELRVQMLSLQWKVSTQWLERRASVALLI
jgi:hypothetical protein